ncbi:MAG: hypothetical protein AWT59_2435 [Candidatus Gallionella acididurans]|uniref:Uncharacterized protein n=1 Tax=Candidatus Gallionella acididurans TaxID=1796491 RepID=A0A139BQZ6_9PROT|nr:MAG: hypothetical protein AWT59_2435 [Candidatus Gallionella acididurans]
MTLVCLIQEYLIHKRSFIMKNVLKNSTLVDRMIMVAFIGILAAVAIPAYGEYSVHAKADQTLTHLNGGNLPMTEIYMTTGLL